MGINTHTKASQLFSLIDFRFIVCSGAWFALYFSLRSIFIQTHFMVKNRAELMFGMALFYFKYKCMAIVRDRMRSKKKNGIRWMWWRTNGAHEWNKFKMSPQTLNHDKMRFWITRNKLAYIFNWISQAIQLNDSIILRPIIIHTQRKTELNLSIRCNLRSIDDMHWNPSFNKHDPFSYIFVNIAKKIVLTIHGTCWVEMNSLCELNKTHFSILRIDLFIGLLRMLSHILEISKSVLFLLILSLRNNRSIYRYCIYIKYIMSFKWIHVWCTRMI